MDCRSRTSSDNGSDAGSDASYDAGYDDGSNTNAGNWRDVIDTRTAPLTDDIIEYVQYLDYNVDELENFQRYNKGGFHPVHPDDVLDGRFEVVHKLGNGGYGMVWLCRDIASGKWRAVKIMAASRFHTREDEILSYLRDRCSPEELEENHILLPLERFWLEGPNGRHMCLVMPVCGWPVSDWRLAQDDYKPDTDPDVRDVCQQIVKSLRFLHRNGICHGDFRPKNILMKIEGIDEMGKDEVLDLMDEIEVFGIPTRSGEPLSLRAPKYSVKPADPYWCEKISTKSIAVIDFGESFFANNPPKTIGIPNLYAAPEILFEGTGNPGPYSDIWSLACTIFEVRTHSALFESLFGSSGSFGIPISGLERYLGPLPRVYRKSFSKMVKRLLASTAPKEEQSENSSEGELESDSEHETDFEPQPAQEPEQNNSPESDEEQLCSLETRLGREEGLTVEMLPPEYVPEEFRSAKNVALKYSPTEIRELADLMRKMLKYNPTERIDIGTVASHPWTRFKPTHAGLNPQLRVWEEYILPDYPSFWN